MASHDASFAVGTNGTTATLTGVAVAANSNRALYIWINIGNIANTASSVVRDGQSATQIFNQASSADVRLQCWRILAPNTGTASVVVTMSATTAEIVVAAVSLYDVDQTTPEGTFAYISSSPTAHPYSRTVTAASTSDLVLDCVGISTGTPSVTSTAGSGQTQRFQNNTKQYRTIHGGTKPGTAGSVVMEQTPSVTTINKYLYSAVVVNGASSGTTISCTVGDAVAAGSTALIQFSTTVAATVGNAVAAGSLATITIGGATIISATVGNAVADGSTVSLPRVLAGAAGNAAAAGSLSGIANLIKIGPMINNTETGALADQAVVYTWTPGGRIGSMVGLTPVDGTGTTDSSGYLTTNITAAPGRLDVAVRNANATLDDVAYKAFV